MSSGPSAAAAGLGLCGLGFTVGLGSLVGGFAAGTATCSTAGGATAGAASGGGATGAATTGAGGGATGAAGGGATGAGAAAADGAEPLPGSRSLPRVATTPTTTSPIASAPMTPAMIGQRRGGAPTLDIAPAAPVIVPG